METSFYKDSYAIHLALHLLLTANHKNNKFNFNHQDIIIKRGQVLTGRNKLSNETGIKTSTVRRKLDKLRKTGFLSIKTTNRFSIITINKYDSYQSFNTKDDQQSEHQMNIKRTANEHQMDTNKTVKNDKTVKNKISYIETSTEFQLSKLLLDLIIKRDPNYKKPNLQDWSKHIDYLIRLDNRKPENIREVITWCQSDDFWQNNILSTKKLRKQFNQLYLKLKKSEEYI